MRSRIAAAGLLGLALAGCAPQTPEQARIDNIQDAASAEAEAIESASKNQIGQIEGDLVEVHLADAAAPTLIRENDSSPALYVLMPMRV